MSFLTQRLQVQKYLYVNTNSANTLGFVQDPNFSVFPLIRDTILILVMAKRRREQKQIPRSYLTLRCAHVHPCVTSSALFRSHSRPHSMTFTISPGIACGLPEKRQALESRADSHLALIFFICMTLGVLSNLSELHVQNTCLTWLR